MIMSIETECSMSIIETDTTQTLGLLSLLAAIALYLNVYCVKHVESKAGRIVSVLGSLDKFNQKSQ